jgi:hypothetical protein
MNTVINTVRKIEANRKSIIDRFSEKLNMTIDSQGRYHAPAGGCTFEGIHYLGGEYLPFEDSVLEVKPSKALIQFNDFESFKSVLKDYAPSHGKTWEKNSVTFCYIYFSGYESGKIAKAIESYYANKTVDEVKKIVGQSPEGKVEVTGTVLKLSFVDSRYGYATKMLVELENGSRVFGTAPQGDFGQGDKIVFKADFSVKEHGFSFFKRPKLLNVVTLQIPCQ